MRLRVNTLASALLLTAMAANAALTPDQRVEDFRGLAALVIRHYAPAQWKQELWGYDILKLDPWIAKVRAAKDDIEYLDICHEYLAGVQDGHVSLAINSVFFASLGLGLDLYDGRVLVDSLSTFFTAQRLPLGVGDEIVSVDGRPVGDWIAQLSRYSQSGNERATSRIAAQLISSRSQSSIPWAHRTGDTARIEAVRLDGSRVTFDARWSKSGDPITELGGVRALRRDRGAPGVSLRKEFDNAADWGAWTGPRGPEPLAALDPAARWIRENAEESYDSLRGELAGISSFTPQWSPPAGFQIRLGARSTDQFLSGTWRVGNATVGYLRIPSFTPSNTNLAITQFATELQELNSTTSALVLDIANNGGGNACLPEVYLGFLVPRSYWGVSSWFKATQRWVAQFESRRDFARATGEAWEIRSLELYTNLMRAAYQEGGYAGVFPLCGATSTPLGAQLYNKPVMLLVNEFSFSAADRMAALFQDARRGPLFGRRTSGLGGTVVTFPGPPFSEGSVRLTVALGVRERPVTTPGGITSRFYENVGVWPDIDVEYQTRDNLLQRGAPFLNRLSAELARLIGQ